MSDLHAAAQEAADRQARYEAILAPYIANGRAFLGQEVNEHFRPLMNCPSWLTYRCETDGVKVKKTPLHRDMGCAHNGDDVANHTKFSNAVYLLRNEPHKRHGVGFAFTPAHPFVGIDIDWYKLVEGSAQQDIVADLLKFPTLTTRSLSGKGFHLWGYLHTPMPTLGALRQGLLGCIEIYWSRRFFATTFDVWRDAPIVDATKLVDRILDKHVELGGTLDQTPNSGPLPPANLDLETVLIEVRYMSSLRYQEQAYLFPLASELGDPIAVARRQKALANFVARYPEAGRADGLPYDANKVDMSIARTLAQKTSNEAHFIEVLRRLGILRPERNVKHRDALNVGEKQTGYYAYTFRKALGLVAVDKGV